MTSAPETRIQTWDQSLPVDTQLRTIVTFLVGTLGVVLVSLLLWALMHIVR
jgi:hypothetical protein